MSTPSMLPSLCTSYPLHRSGLSSAAHGMGVQPASVPCLATCDSQATLHDLLPRRLPVRHQHMQQAPPLRPSGVVALPDWSVAPTAPDAVPQICAGASDEVLISGGYDQAVKVGTSLPQMHIQRGHL